MTDATKAEIRNKLQIIQGNAEIMSLEQPRRAAIIVRNVKAIVKLLEADNGNDHHR